MEMQQIIGMLAIMQERMDANTKAMQENQAKSDADRKADREERKPDKEEMLAKMEANTKAMQENQETTARMDVKIGSMHDELISTLKNFKFNGKETPACQETMEARLEAEEPVSVDTTPEVADDQEVPVEDAEVLSVAEPRKRRRDERNLAAVRRQKKQNRDLDTRRRGKEQERAQRKMGA
jgi:hypothetical protein